MVVVMRPILPGPAGCGTGLEKNHESADNDLRPNYFSFPSP